MDAGIEPLAGDSNRQQTQKSSGQWMQKLSPLQETLTDSRHGNKRTVDAGIEPLAGDSNRQQTRKISGQWMQELSPLQETLTDSRQGK